MTDFSDRTEGEIKTHEKEMLRKAVIAKYGSKNLTERIRYAMDRHKQDLWTAEQMFAKLTELGLNGTDGIADVKNLFNNPAHTFPSKVTA
jgi:hypothetical protein